MCQMLLSINPEHVENILNGSKLVEFRKTKCKQDVDEIIIYSTAPVMQVVAKVIVEKVIIGDVHEVWQQTKTISGISYNFYRNYYKGKRTAVAYRLGKVQKYPKPKSLADFGISHPPQSFMYITSEATT